MEKLTSDGAQSDISTRVKDVLSALLIDEWQSEAFHQNQNFDERRCQTIK